MPLLPPLGYGRYASEPRLPLAPLSVWIRAQIDALACSDLPPVETVAERLHMDSSHLARLARAGWLHATTEARRPAELTSIPLVRADALCVHAGMMLWEIWPDMAHADPGEQLGAILAALCPVCEIEVVPHLDGTCPACGVQTGGGAVDQTVLASAADDRRCPECRGPKSRGAARCQECHRRARTGVPRPRVDPGARVCPGCSGPKATHAATCWACYMAAGGHTGRRVRKGSTLLLIRPDTLERARELYASGLSMRAVAQEILPQTEYKSAASAASCLYTLFRSRGWPLRDRSVATARANRKRAWRPQCAHTIGGGTRKGQRCPARAIGDDGLCWHHRPENIAAGVARLRSGAPSR